MGEPSFAGRRGDFCAAANRERFERDGGKAFLMLCFAEPQQSAVLNYRMILGVGQGPLQSFMLPRSGKRHPDLAADSESNREGLPGHVQSPRACAAEEDPSRAGADGLGQPTTEAPDRVARQGTRVSLLPGRNR